LPRGHRGLFPSSVLVAEFLADVIQVVYVMIGVEKVPSACRGNVRLRIKFLRASGVVNAISKVAATAHFSIIAGGSSRSPVATMRSMESGNNGWR
jgi:hypothetical protein